MRRWRSPILLAVSAALLLTAFFAVSELATLRGAKAHDASAYLTRELGSPLSSASLVREPARIHPALGGKLEIRDGGVKVTSGRDHLSLRFTGDTEWRQYRNGVSRPTSFGREVISFGDNRVEQSLLVNRHYGKKVWRWQLRSNLDARVAVDGSIRLGGSPLRILPVAILDTAGKDVTPRGLRWSLGRHTLELRLDDRDLPTRYVIDPVALVGACGPGAGDFAGCSVHTVNNKADFTSSPVLRPSSVSTGDLMIAAVATRNTDVINPPSGWTAIGNRRTQTNIEQALFYRFATSADTSTTTYSWSWTNNADAIAAIFAYSGVDSTNPFDVTPTDNSGTGTTATATGVTTTQNGDMLTAFYTAANNVTLTQTGSQGLTQEYTAISGGGTRLRATAADGTQASPGASGNKTAAVGSSQNWVAHLAALTPALSADGSGTMTASINNVSASQTGRTITFTYTAASGGMLNGSVTLAVPSGWSAPSTTATAAGYTTSSTGTVSVSGQTITVSNLTLAGGATMTITYGSTAGGGPGATATSTTGSQAWTVQQKSRSTGTLTNIASSPSITVYAADGSGTTSSSISTVSASQTGRTITFTYTAAAGGMSNGTVTLVVPSGWTAPSTTSSNNGYTTGDTGTVSVSGQTITVSSVTLAGGGTLTIAYGDTSGGGSGATATSTTGAQTWQVQQKSTSAGSLANIATSPSITVYGPDGSGTLTSGTSSVSASQTGRTITFTYTVATGGISGGSVTLAVPSGWSAPSTTGSNAGYTTASSGTVSVSGQTITVSSLTLGAGSTFTITYGSTAGGGAGATATSTTGAQTWTTQEKSTTNGSLTSIGSSPSITVYAADGSGTMSSGTSSVSASQTGRTVTFTYTAATGGISNGTITLVVPTGWSAPSTTGSNAGYTTASSGTVSVSGQTITISSLTLGGGSTFTLTYGSTAGGGPGATATSSTGSQTWTTQEKSTAGGSLSDIASQPSITVYAGDGSGTMSSSISNVSASQSGRTVTFTYTAATGGISNGTVMLVVPSGWTAPSTTASNNGYTTASSGTVSVSGQTITVSSLTVAGGSTFTITYGDTSGGGSGATATSSTGAQTWQVQEKSTSGGSLTNIGSSPSITVYAGDGSGTMSSSIANVSASQSGRTVTFTYTAATGGISNGTVTLVVPSGWSAASTTGSAAGYTTASSGTPSVSGQTITVSSLTLGGGATLTITYGSTASGGPGATATSSTGSQTWTTQEKSTSAGSLTNIASQPSITVYAADGSGTLTSSTSEVVVGSTGNTITFTYTAATGGLSNGSVTVVVPSGWSAPSTTGSNAGYTTASTGSVSVSSQTITVSNVTLAGGSTLTITYGSTAGGGPGATATGSAGAQTWQAQEKSTSAGSLTDLGSSTSINVLAADGSGTLTTGTGAVNSASSGNTITFTYTAATGGMSNGTVTLVVPNGWSAPSTTGSAVGYTTASSGSVSVSSQTITVSSLTLAGGATFTITYGSTAGGGPGATAPVTAAAQTWQAQQKSSSGGTLTNLASSPAITVNDTTAPSAPNLTFGSFTNASVTGTTVYIRQGSAGGFTVAGTSSDTESGIDHLTFASGFGSGWTGGGQDNSTPYNAVYTFSAAATAPAGNQDVTATNGWTLTSGATSFTVAADTTPPSVAAPSVTAGYYTSLSVPVTKNGGTDGGSDVDASTSVLQRDEVALTGGSCGSFPGSWSTVTLSGGNDTSVVSGKCYRYRELLSDNVGNQGTSAASSTAKVDTSAPSTPTLAFSGLSANAYWDGSSTFYFRPSAGGTFTVTAASSDAQSGIGSYTFGTLNSNGGANFGGSQTGDHFDYTFDGTTTAPSTARIVSATNGAGTGSGDATYSIAADTTAPSVTAPGVTAGYYTSLSVPVTKNGGTDGASGVDSSTSVLERDEATLSNGTCGGFSGTWTTVTLSGGNDTGVQNAHCYEYRERLSDHVGNQGTSGVSNIAKVDNQAPTNIITLTSLSPAGAALKNGSTIYYRGSVGGGGSFKLTNAVGDGDSGPASSATASLGGTTSGWSHTASTVSTPAGGPYESNAFSWAQGTTSSPTEVVTAADGAGNTTDAATLTFTNDSTAPTGGALSVNGGATYSTSGSFPIDTRTDYTETQSATESGLASSTLTRAAATLTNDSCGTYGSPTTIVGSPAQTLPTGCYLYTLTGTDNVGNTASISTTVKVDTSDPSAPTFTFSNFTGTTSSTGNIVFFLPTGTGSFDVTASSSDGDSGISGYTFPSAASFGSGWSVSGSGATRTYSYSPGAATPGTKTVTAANNAGRTASSDFSVIVSDTTPPTTTIQCNAAACQGGYYTSAPVSVTLSADDGAQGSGVDVIRYTIDGSDPTPVNGSDYIGPIDIVATTTVKFRAYDNLGNEEAVGSQLVRVDATPPSGQTITLTGADAPYYGSTSVSFTLGNGSDGESGLDASTATVTRETGDLSGDSCSNFTADAGTFSSPDTAVSGAHCYRYSFTIQDNAGNTSAPVTATAKVDTDNPSVTLTDPGTPVAGVVSLSASSSDSSTAVQQVVFERAPAGGSTWTTIGTDASAPYSASWNTGAVADGLYDLRAVSTDTVGHIDTDVVASRRVDNTAPDTTVDSAPADPSNDATPTFTFSSSETGSTFQCRVDGGGWSSCTSPHTTGSLGEGSHTFDVRATDPAGNTDASPASSTWTIDLTAPNTTIDSSPSDPSGNATPSFTFSSSESGSTFECRIDGGSWSSCSSPHTTASLSDGSHTFDVRATDVAGNTDGSPASHTWTVDLTAPQTTIDSTPSSPTNDTTPTFDFSSSETGSTFQCRVDGGSWTSCTSPHTTAALGEGTHTFDVRATDPSGNTDASPASFTWTIDLTAPNTTVDSGPADPSSDATPTFTFSASEPGSTFECRVDGGGWSSCTSPHTTAALGEGSHTFEVRATDIAGNTDASPAGFTWTVDLTAPQTTIDSSPSDPSGNATPTFTFSSSESGSSFECRLDAGSWSSCASPHTTSALSEGSHTFDVRATDQAGNTDGSPASHTWTVDLTAPQTTIDSSPSSPTNDTTPTFTFSASEPGSSFECRVDGGAWSSCTSPHTTTAALSEGTHTFEVRATDPAGNTDASPASFTWTIDVTAPNTTLDSGPTNPSNDTTPTFAFSASEPGSSFECRVDGASWSSCTSPHTTAALGEGSHTFAVRATDPAGNTDASPASSTWTIDLTAPNTTIDSAPPALDNDATPTFTFSSSESGSSFECRVDSGSWTSCTSPHTTAALGEGSHTFDVRATDAAGNTDATPASHTWSIDLGPPTVTITAPTRYINSSDPSTYSVTASTPDGDVAHVDFYECSNASVDCATGTWTQFDTDNSAPFSGSWSTPGSDGTRALRAVAVDAALNTGEDVRTVTIDRTAPSGVSVSYPDGYVTGSFAITTDNGPDSDVDASSAALERSTGNLAGDACSSYGGWGSATSPDSVASSHCANYRYRIADNAGNWTTATSGNEVKSDTAAPTSAQDDPGATLRQTVTLTSSASDTGGSGLASVAFQRRPAGGGSWTTIATDTTSPYSTSFDTTGVTDGLYDFRTVATDVAGNAETSPVVVANRRIDNTAPSATMLSPGNPARGTVTLTSNTSDGGSGIDTVTYELAPNSGSFNTQPATWDTTLGADGLYDLRVTATDVAGNSTTSPIVTTRVDNTPPALTFSSPASGDTVSGTVSLTASASDASPASPPITFAYKLHSDPPSAYTATGSSWNTTSLPGGDGVYDLRARATDDATNTTTVENTSIRVDNVAPSVAITAPAAAINGSLPSPTSFSATASDPGGSGVAQVQFFECSDQSSDCATGIWSPLGTVAAPGPYTVSWNIPGTDGNHALAAVATDNAGHPSSDIRNVDVDRTAPETTIVGKPADPSNAASPTFTFSSSEPGSSFECRIDGGAFAPCTSPHSVSGLTDNAHTFDVRATDPAGNTDASPDTWTWHRDTSNPTGTLDHPGANIRQTVTLTSTESDPPASGYASGLASVDYEYSSDGSSWASIGTLSSAPYDSILWNTTGVADGIYQLRVVVHDVAGNSAASAAVTNVRIDNTPPTTSQDDPGPYLRATKTLTGSAADSGSGIDYVDFQRAPTGGGAWTTIATDSTPGDGFQASFDTTSVSDGHYDFRTVAFDVAGNQAAATPVTDRLVDNTPPNATLNDPGAYLRGAVSLTSSTSDPGGANASGVVGVAYEYSTNGGATWQPTGSTFDSTSVADGNVDLHVIATDAAGNTATSATVTKLVDNTKPSTSDDAPSGWHASPVTVTLTPSDAGSGVNVTEYSVDGNPSYTVGTSVVIPAPADGSNDGAHTIAYFSVDNAGNIETVKSATVLIDATPPVCPSCSAADYLRGTVTLSASPDPDGSGIKSVAFEYSDAGLGTWTTIGTDTTGPAPYTADWDTTAVPDGHYDLRILITDNAGNVTTADLPDKVVDNTAPDVALVGAPTEGQIVTGTVGIAASASDVTSPVASVEFFVRGSSVGTDTTAPFGWSWNTTSGPDGAATIQIVVTDMAGNSTTSAVRNVTVDNLSPTPTLADPGQNLSGTVSLTASSDADTIQVDFERRPAGGGAWTTIASDSTLPWGTSLDTTTLADGLYDFRAVATDGTSHTGTSPIRANIRIDNTAPAGSLTAPTAGSTVGGTSVTLSASVSDAGSGVASVSYELRPTGGGSFSQIASSSSAPFDATWDATTVSTGSYDMRPVITDRAGNTFNGAVVTFNVDVTAPTVTLTNPGSTIFGTVTLNATVSGSGATNVVFAATPAGGATWTSLGTDTASPWSVAYDTTKLADGLYDLRATVTDNLGNSSQDVVSGVRVDNTAPHVVSSSPAEGSTVAAASAISLVTSEPATPIGVTLDGAATVTPVVSGTTIDYNTGALGVGPHTLAGELQDPSGKRAPFRVHFTVYSSGAAPYVEKNTSSSSPTTVTAVDGFASATMPAGAWSTSGNDWIVLRITPTAAPSGLTNGFGPGPEALDVTAWWALSGTQLHELAQPVEIVIHSTERGLVPATWDGTAWRVIHRVPTAGTLPSGWDDGFFTDASGFHVLTKHLSLFALLHDLQAPQAPQNVRGYVGPTGLTIRWLPGSDNSGTYDFVTVFADSTDSGHYGPDFTAATVAGWTPGDTRIFRLQETDLAGNQSELTQPLVPVPSLIGMTPDQAEAALAARGLSIGSLTVGGTGKPGMVTGPEGLVLAGQGSAIDLTVAPGGASTSLVFKVVTAPKFKPSARKKIAARVTVTRAARVTAQLFSPRGVKLYTWHFSVRAGRTIVKLKIPRQVRRPGIYKLRWSARAGRETVSRVIKIRVLGSVVPVQKVEIVLAGTAAQDVRGKLGKQKPKVVTGVEPAFDAAADRTCDVRVIVVDVDELGVGVVRDLHTVFPSVKIVALAAGPKTMAAALKAGGTVVLPRSTPPATLAKIIQRLAKRR